MHLDSTWVGWIATRHAITHEVWSCFSNCNSIFENYTLGIRCWDGGGGGWRSFRVYLLAINKYLLSCNIFQCMAWHVNEGSHILEVGLNWIELENSATLAHEPWQWIATFSFYVSLAVSPTINEWNCDIGNGRNKLKLIGFCDTLRKIGNNNSNVLLLPHMQLLQRIVFYSNRETEAAIYMHMELPAQVRQWNNNSRRGKQNGISLLFNSSWSRWRGEDKNSFIGKVGLLL